MPNDELGDVRRFAPVFGDGVNFAAVVGLPFADGEGAGAYRHELHGVCAHSLVSRLAVQADGGVVDVELADGYAPEDVGYHRDFDGVFVDHLRRAECSA